MAELVASAGVKMLMEMLGSGVRKQLALISGVKDEIGKLERLLPILNHMFNEAEKKLMGDESLLLPWLKDLKHAAFDAEDVVDEFRTEELRRKTEGENRIAGKVHDFFSPHNQVVFNYKMARKIRNVRKRLAEIVESRREFVNTLGASSSSSSEAWERVSSRQTGSFVTETEVYGRDEDREKIVDFLLHTDNEKDVSILPIVGLGGVGKTTLAQFVYNDARIETGFSLRIWVCVSESFSVIRIMRAIVECVTGGNCKLSNIEPLQQKLREELREKKFFLVLDDVWNEDEAEWEKLKPYLRCGKQGSKIIVTTRSDVVAMITGTGTPPYRLEGLPIDYCWVLFRERAFGLGREQETPKLLEIGKEIVRKCGGSPLAAKSMGSLMSCKRGEAEWSAIRESELWELPTKILPALKISYDHLPLDLKKCFSYCSQFPKDHEIEKEELIQMWIAEGFIQVSDRAEDIGSEYFNSLLWRSFFQGTESYGNEFRYKMHDLVHDLACFVALASSAAVDIGSEKSMVPGYDGCRYLTLTDSHWPKTAIIPDDVYEANRLRSLVLFANIAEAKWENFRHLRVLDLSNQEIEKLPSAIVRLKHLRYLNLSSNHQMKELPTRITSLYNLQTLNLRFCWSLKSVPTGIGNLINLRHLDISGCQAMTVIPRGLGRLSRLQALPRFSVETGPESSNIAELKHLNQLGGVLQITGLQNVKDAGEANEANLRAKTRLQELVLRGCEDKDVLEKLHPPSDIKRLKLRDYSGMGFPSWMLQIEQLSNLTQIELYDVERCECLPAFGQLPLLEELNIEGMSGVKRIGKEFLYSGNCDDTKSSAAGGGTNIYNNNNNNNNVVFRSLKRLRLWAMPDLEEWSTVSETGSLIFPCLEYLQIEYCPRLRIQPYLPSSIVELEIRDSNEELLSSTETGGGGGGCLKGLSSLKKLTINDCKASSSPCAWDGLQYLTALEELEIQLCDDLTEGLPDGMVQQSMPSLRTLTLYSDRNLKSLIREAQQQQQPPPFFTHLHRLRIEGCNALTALPEWVGGLTSLQSLEINGCENIAMLPDGLQHLTRLQKLTISRCPVLQRRCEREKGEDWHKIAHIPNIILSDFYF